MDGVFGRTSPLQIRARPDHHRSDERTAGDGLQQSNHADRSRPRPRSCARRCRGDTHFRSRRCAKPEHRKRCPFGPPRSFVVSKRLKKCCGQICNLRVL